MCVVCVCVDGAGRRSVFSGAYALAGAAATLGGVQRATISLVPPPPKKKKISRSPPAPARVSVNGCPSEGLRE